MPTLSTIGAACARAWGFTSGLVKDQYFNLTSLLLPGNGTNGAQNNTFLDGSSNNFTITRNGNTTQGTFSPFSQTGWSNYFGSSTANIVFASDASFGVGTGNFSVELSVNFNAWTGNQVLFLTGTSVNVGLYLDKPSSGNTLRFGDPNGTIISYSWTPNIGQWYNIAVVRAGTGTNQTTLYIDGVAVATGTSTASIPAYTAMVGGINYASPYNTQGYISNLRFSNVARTISNPTSFFTSDANTLLLTCRSNRFVDISGTPKTISQINGTTSVTPFSPFAPTQSYSASAVGGSGYFDGTGDYLTAPASSSWVFTGDHTIEAWIYISSLADGTIYGTGGAGQADQFTYTSAGELYWGNQGTPTGVIKANTWNHVAASRSGTTLKIFVNGAEQKSATVSGTIGQNATAWIGGRNTSSNYVNGYICNLRVINGTAVYTGAFTPPTAPISTSGSASASAYPSTTNVNTSFASSDTKLLLNFTNAGVVDATAKNVLETVGNAQISTTQSKWGGGSMYFDGSSSYLRAQSNSGVSATSMMFGTGPYTIEMWVYQTARNVSYGAYLISNQSFQANITGSGTVNANKAGGSDYATTTATVSLNTWTHIAFVRTSTSANGFKIYINGSDSATGTDSTDYSSATQLNIATTASGGANYVFTGYIDDLRITRYARTITASPSAPFPLQ